jgi:LuxR family transcriptional activator of bioluminescence operon
MDRGALGIEMRAELADVLSDLETLATEQAFKKKFAKTFSGLGFNTYTYVNVDVDAADEIKSKQANDFIYLTNLAPAWVERYFQEKYGEADPVVRDCLTERLPIRWTESYRSNSRGARETVMMQDAWENGIKRGLTIPIHGPRGELGIFSLNADLNDREFMKATDISRFEAQVIAYHFHDAVQRTLKPARQVPLPTPLTDREVEILQWTVEGKTAWEIGGILKISERTVNFHIQNVMEKFGVHNKTHAAAKAVGLGLLPI